MLLTQYLSHEWVKELNDGLETFMSGLMLPGQPGRFLPCKRGATKEGRALALAFSCLALKTYVMLGLWDDLPGPEKNEWIEFIQSFQIEGVRGQNDLTHGGFIDPPEVDYLKVRESFKQIIKSTLFRKPQLPYWQLVVMAETKQAIATLREVGAQPLYPYRGFPYLPGSITTFLENLDWQRPWGAGAQAAALALFIRLEAPRFIAEKDCLALSRECASFLDSVVDKRTGAYFKGSVPIYENMINGAMKVLTALDWLGVPIHYPDQLIDSCLTRLPNPDGCHLVDAIYVLQRCSQISDHRRKDIENYFKTVAEMIMKHHNEDGGFSYFIGRSQTVYYRIPISLGYIESDIHGTVLLTWAMVMILDFLHKNYCQWRVIRP